MYDGSNYFHFKYSFIVDYVESNPMLKSLDSEVIKKLYSPK